MKILKAVCLFLLIITLSCNKKAEDVKKTVTTNFETKTENVSYEINGTTYKSFVAYDENSVEAKPVIMVIPEWWGLTDYAKDRAKKLAKLGYFAMVVDFYGEGKTVDNPADAETLSTPFYGNSGLAKSVFDAARSQLSKYKNANIQKIAVIGYCFGGAQALNMARLESDLKGAVSFHGNLMTGVKPNSNQVPILVCNGAADSFVPADEITAFKKEMDSAKINMQFIDYPNAVHSFTNPASTEIGKKFDMKVAYNKEADEKSWQDMQNFFVEIFK